MVSEIKMNYQKRLQNLRARLHFFECDAFIIEHATDIFYLTGLEVSVGKLLVSEKEQCIIVDGRYLEYCLNQTLYSVLLFSDTKVKEWLRDFNIHRLGFDQQKTSYQDFCSLKSSIEPEIKIFPIESPLIALRMTKDADEIAVLKEAAQLGYTGYQYVKTLLKEGITEKELAFELELFWRKKGASRLAFDSIVAFGANGSMPHYRPHSISLKQNQSILLDCGVVLHSYHSDMTRMLQFGSIPKEIEVIQQIVEDAKNLAFSYCKPGTHIGELDKVARDYIDSKGYGAQFNHSLGHGLGLDIHEPPFIRQNGKFSSLSLEEGMVLTIEPGIYLPGVGGVRLEDTILITEKSYENLTQVKS